MNQQTKNPHKNKKGNQKIPSKTTQQNKSQTNQPKPNKKPKPTTTTTTKTKPNNPPLQPTNQKATKEIPKLPGMKNLMRQY